jgi:hypothetical protein
MPSDNSHYSPPPPTTTAPTRQGNIKKRRNSRNRREYALGEFDFESRAPEQQGDSDMLAAYGLTTDSAIDTSAKMQGRAERYYGDQILVPHGSVSPCINATDRARRARRSRVREPDSDQHERFVAETSTFYNITPLLREPRSPESVALPSRDRENRPTDDGITDEGEIPAMLLTDDEDSSGKDFEIIDYEPISEHNGTVRRWYRGFRH